MTVERMLFALTKTGGAFHYRRHFCAVPNMSWGLLEWEADLAVITNSGWLWEVEIKSNATDWLADARKAKWDLMARGTCLSPRRFYYAAPDELAMRFDEFNIPKHAGVVSIREDRQGRLTAVVVKPATDRPQARKLTSEEMLKAARLGTMRFWTENHKRVQLKEWKERTSP